MATFLGLTTSEWLWGMLFFAIGVGLLHAIIELSSNEDDA